MFIFCTIQPFNTFFEQIVQHPAILLLFAAVFIFAFTALILLFMLLKEIRKNKSIAGKLQILQSKKIELQQLLDCAADLGKINYLSGTFNDAPDLRTPENNPVYKFIENRSESLTAVKKEEYLNMYRKFFSGTVRDFSIKYSLPAAGEIKELCDYCKLISQPDSPEEKFILMTMDISELAKQNRELANADTILNAIFDNLPGYIVIKSMASDFTYLRCNNTFSSILHKHPEEIAGKTDFDLFNHELAKRIRHVDMQIAANHSIADNRWFFTTPDDKEHALRFISRPLKQPDGTEFIIGFGIDITRQERIAAKMRKRNKDLRLLLAQSSDQSMLLDSNLHLACAAPSMYELFPPETVNSEKLLTCSNICSCGVTDPALCPAAAALFSGHSKICTQCAFSGKVLHIKPLPDESGVITCLAVTLHDNTPEQEQE